MYILFYFTLLLIFLYGVLINYYERAFGKVPVFHCDDSRRQETVNVSVIIPARNEENNILHCLQSIKNQTYPASSFEVIVVNDHSTDNTSSLVNSFPMENLRVVELSAYISQTPVNSFKKKAIEAGIASATGELIVTTDADCVATPGWLSCLVNFYRATDAVFIAAPVKMTGKKSLLSIFQSLDFMTLQGITAASVHNRFHNMCNGANLAYLKTAFHEVGGFAGIDHIASGDDMLLMQKISKVFPDRIFFLKSKAAIISTSTEPTFTSFLNQRVRWASKAGSYSDKKITSVLMLVYLVNLFLLAFLVAGIFKPVWLLFFFLLVVVKLLLEVSFVRKIAQFFNEAQLLKYFPLFQPLHIIYVVIAGWLGIFGSYRWKERKVK
jgi:cellulose synthase/poly-beta-1,6-N-acetylglucosamine synthase-like glycosyltransferase